MRHLVNETIDLVTQRIILKIVRFIAIKPHSLIFLQSNTFHSLRSVLEGQVKEGIQRSHRQDVCWFWQSLNQSCAILHLLVLSVADLICS